MTESTDAAMPVRHFAVVPAAGPGTDAPRTPKAWKDMTQQERETYATKANVWPSIDYSAMVEAGAPNGVAYLVKRIKDTVATKPEHSRAATDDAAVRAEEARRYVEIIAQLKNKLPSVRSIDDIRDIRKDLFPGDAANRLTAEANKDLSLIGGRNILNALQPRSWDLSEAESKAKKSGFPEKQEAWQKQYVVRLSRAGDKVYQKGQEVVLDKDDWFVTKKGKYSIEQSGFSSREEAEAWARDKVNATRATMGAVMNRLDHVINNLSNVSMNLSESRSHIEDADYAKASTELAKTQIMQQAATAVLAQANTSQQTVLKLLG
jgi:flagellin